MDGLSSLTVFLSSFLSPLTPFPSHSGPLPQLRWTPTTSFAQKPDELAAPNPTAMFPNLHCSVPSPTTSNDPSPSKPKPAGHGASIKAVRRPRSRSPSSKNKLKPPLIITRDPEPTISPYILKSPRLRNRVVGTVDRDLEQTQAPEETKP